MNIKNRIGSQKIFELCLFIIFAAQFFICIYFNVALLGEHMGYDSSWSYLKASLIWKEKTLISDVWNDQTNVFLDSSMLLAALLYGITGNLLVSYGIANSIVLAGIVWCISGIVKDMELGRDAQLIAVNLVICPYLMNGFSISNDLGYFNCLISGPAFYSVRALLFLMIIRVVINLQKEKRLYLCSVISLFLCILTGLSSGMFMTIMILLPCILYFMENVFIDNNLSGLKRPEALYVYVCLFCSFLGKIIGERVLNLSAIDTSRTWVSIENIWKNIGSVIQGFMMLLGVFPVSNTEIEILSGEGICRLFSVAIFTIAVIAFVFCIRICIKNGKIADCKLLLICNIIICNFIVLSLFNATYGSPIFESRYLICTYMAIIILIAYFWGRLDKKLMISLCLEGVLIAGILGTDIVSDCQYVKTANDYMQMPEIKEVVEATDAEVVYCWGNSLNLLSRNMRVYDLSRIYKCISDEGGYIHWGDYLYYDKGDYFGPAIMITDLSGSIIPEEIMNNCCLIGTTDTVNIYYCPNNPVNMEMGQ